MKLKNYTTKIAAERTIGEIQKLLMIAGATAIAFNNKDGRVDSIFFKLKVNENEMPFKLPAQPDRVYQVVFAGMKGGYQYKESRLNKSRDIAWRIVFDWLKAQIAIIQLEQVEVAQVFLPYLVTGENESLYDRFKAGKNNLLGSGD